MGGAPVIETVRPGVQFTPEAAAAFRRAEAQVRAEFGRDIDVNSTYRDWDTQLWMYNAWVAYKQGRGPHPGHSKALHPDDPLAFHTKGLALDSDDWRNARIVQILAEHGFIRNRLYVPNENHHFEYIRDRDQSRYDPAPAGLIEEDDMFTDEDRKLLREARDLAEWNKKRLGGSLKGPSITDMVRVVRDAARTLLHIGQWVKDRIGGSNKTGPSVTDLLREIDKQTEAETAE